MRIRFTRRVVHETEGPGLGPVFDVDSVHDLREDYARKWIGRGVAVEHVEASPAGQPVTFDPVTADDVIIDTPAPKRRGRPRKDAE